MPATPATRLQTVPTHWQHAMSADAYILAIVLLGAVAVLALFLWRRAASRHAAALLEVRTAQSGTAESRADARLADERALAVEATSHSLRAELATQRERLSAAETRAVTLQTTLDILSPQLEEKIATQASAAQALESARAAGSSLAKDLDVTLARAASSGARVEELGRELAAALAQSRELHGREVELAAANAQLATQVANSAREIGRMKEWVNESTEALRVQMADIASRVINDSTTQFRAESKEQLELMLKPFDKDLAAFRERIEHLYLDETKERNSLQGEVRRLAEISSKVALDAQNLALALRGDSRARGNWGEVVLGRVLEMSGLREGHEYSRQHHVSDEDGGSGRLDILVRLPQERCVVIDSKVSLVAYDRYVNAGADEDSGAFVKAHMESLRSHVKDLAGKEYAKRFGEQAIEYVLLFVPIEPALMLALQHDVELQGFAHERNIVLVSPNTLMAMLKTIDYLWRVEKRTRNSDEIAKRAGKLIDAIAQAAGLLGDLRRQLVTVDNTLRKLGDRFTGRQGLVTHARLINELGAKGARVLPAAGDGEETPEDEASALRPDPLENAASGAGRPGGQDPMH